MPPSPPKLIGTSAPPAVRKEEVVTCLYRDADCVVTGWQDAPIAWPRVRAREVRGGSGLWVNEDLLRAIRTERADALKYWFGVGTNAVWNWRKAFGISRFGTSGSKAAHAEVCRKGAEGIKAKEWPTRIWRRRPSCRNGWGSDRPAGGRSADGPGRRSDCSGPTTTRRSPGGSAGPSRRSPASGSI